MRKICIFCVVCVLFLFSSVAHAQLSTTGSEQNPFIKIRDKFVKQYAEKLEAIAAECEENGLEDEAKITRNWLTRRAKDKIYVAILPQKIGENLLGEDASEEQKDWEKRFLKLREEAGRYLFKQAAGAVKAGHASLGFDFLMEAMREYPDLKQGRKIIGHVEYQGEWRSPFEVQELKNGKVKHSRFGWIPKGYVKRYEDGQRFLRGKWVSMEQEAAVRRNMTDGWVVETAHYRITTNHSLEAGVKLGNELEKLYRVWKQLFLRYFATEKQVQDLFAGKPGLATPEKKHQVYFFRSRDDYKRFLRATAPQQAEISLGVYSEGTQMAYFFAGPDYDPRTMFHEATHQLFAEVRKSKKGAAGNNGNFWVLEGIAMYLESLAEEEGFYVLGGFEDERMLAARYRFNVSKYYVPLEQLCRMTTPQFQTHPQVTQLYTQSAGLTHFLVSYNDGEYRDALVEYLFEVYAGNSPPTLLPRLLKKSFAELNEEYGQFITQELETLDNWVIEEN